MIKENAIHRLLLLRHRKGNTELLNESLDMAIEALRQPERKTGRWIPVTNGRGGFECNQCHCYAPSYQDGVEWLSAFCSNCGAKMEGAES